MTTVNVTIPVRAQFDSELKANELSKVLDSATPEQVKKWVANNITGFNAATLTALKKVIVFILLHIKSR
jgi:hypothetical protein